MLETHLLQQQQQQQQLLAIWEEEEGEAEAPGSYGEEVLGPLIRGSLLPPWPQLDAVLEEPEVQEDRSLQSDQEQGSGAPWGTMGVSERTPALTRLGWDIDDFRHLPLGRAGGLGPEGSPGSAAGGFSPLLPPPVPVLPSSPGGGHVPEGTMRPQATGNKVMRGGTGQNGVQGFRAEGDNVTKGEIGLVGDQGEPVLDNILAQGYPWMASDPAQRHPQVNNGLAQRHPQMDSDLKQGHPWMDSGSAQGHPRMNSDLAQGHPCMDNGSTQEHPQLESGLAQGHPWMDNGLAQNHHWMNSSTSAPVREEAKGDTGSIGTSEMEKEEAMSHQGTKAPAQEVGHNWTEEEQNRGCLPAELGGLEAGTPKEAGSPEEEERSPKEQTSREDKADPGSRRLPEWGPLQPLEEIADAAAAAKGLALEEESLLSPRPGSTTAQTPGRERGQEQRREPGSPRTLPPLLLPRSLSLPESFAYGGRQEPGAEVEPWLQALMGESGSIRREGRALVQQLQELRRELRTLSRPRKALLSDILEQGLIAATGILLFWWLTEQLG
ncbi:collagen alpha-1(VII) chain-like isoform X2 [Ornithorhynchus anatinus]|uniref:collagen alpha-1(VII) chain-like isoform X2 n=1 Tax=Ornithorhynchus anatinus TaxID=9258 RepID=UPI0010A7B73C|nr:collagen alpha-1(VII) chain-like isoform X2 [Ornithorhynchus anatinus]